MKWGSNKFSNCIGMQLWRSLGPIDRELVHTRNPLVKLRNVLQNATTPLKRNLNSRLDSQNKKDTTRKQYSAWIINFFFASNIRRCTNHFYFARMWSLCALDKRVWIKIGCVEQLVGARHASIDDVWFENNMLEIIGHHRMTCGTVSSWK